jgi:protein TonB
MFSMLLESRCAVHSSATGGVLSAGTHAALVMVAITMTQAEPRATLAPERITYTPLVLERTPSPPPGPPAPAGARAAAGSERRTPRPASPPPTFHFDAPGLPFHPVTIDVDYVARAANVDDLRTHASGRDALMPRPVPPDGVYSTHQVEKIAVALHGNPQPYYPDQLRQARVQGRVSVEFIVDTTGRADTTSLRVVRSQHVLFTDAVRAVLPYLYFLPAEVDGRKVRMRVLQPFSFVLRY